MQQEPNFGNNLADIYSDLNCQKKENKQGMQL